MSGFTQTPAMTRKYKRAGMALAGIALACMNAAGAAAIPLLDGREQSVELVDALVNEAMNTREVPGLGVALIHDGRVVFAKAYGDRSLEPKLPLQPDTVMYGASLTKATFAWFVMQLVDEKKIRSTVPSANT